MNCICEPTPAAHYAAQQVMSPGQQFSMLRLVIAITIAEFLAVVVWGAIDDFFEITDMIAKFRRRIIVYFWHCRHDGHRRACSFIGCRSSRCRSYRQSTQRLNRRVDNQERNGEADRESVNHFRNVVDSMIQNIRNRQRPANPVGRGGFRNTPEGRAAFQRREERFRQQRENDENQDPMQPRVPLPVNPETEINRLTQTGRRVPLAPLRLNPIQINVQRSVVVEDTTTEDGEAQTVAIHTTPEDPSVNSDVD